jgi:hypothetical protein
MSNLRGRLNRLEGERGAEKPAFPWQGVLGCGPVQDVENWLRACNYPDALTALRATIQELADHGPTVPVPGDLAWRRWGLAHLAVWDFLENNGYANPREAVAAGALDKVPPDLAAELRAAAQEPTPEEREDEVSKAIEAKIRECANE